MYIKRIELIALILLVLLLGGYAIVRITGGITVGPDYFFAPSHLGLRIPGMGNTSGSAATTTPHSISDPDLEALSTTTAALIQQETKELEAKISAAPGDPNEARLKRHLAESLMPVDTAKAVQMLKDIAANTSYPAMERALAVEMLGDTYFERSDNSPLLPDKYIFTLVPYDAMQAASSSTNRVEILDQFAALSRYAITIAPLPVSEYRLAHWAIRKGNTAEGKAHLEKGNALLEAFTAGLDQQDAYMIPKSYRLKAEAEDYLGRVTHATVLRATAHASYNLARSLAMGMHPEMNPSAAVELMWIDYRYALALQIHVDAKRAALQQELLKELMAHNKPYFRFNEYLRRLGQHKIAPQSVFREEKDILGLAANAPEFKAHLSELGWQF